MRFDLVTGGVLGICGVVCLRLSVEGARMGPIERLGGRGRTGPPPNFTFPVVSAILTPMLQMV